VILLDGAEPEVGLIAVAGRRAQRGMHGHLVRRGIEAAGEEPERAADLLRRRGERLADLIRDPIAHREVGDEADRERGGERGRGERGAPPRPGAIAAEHGEQVIHRRKAIAGPHREPAQHDRAQAARDRRARRHRPHRARAHVVAELLERLALVRPVTVERLVQRDAEAELIGARVDVAAAELLRRHVCRRSEHHAGVRERELVERDRHALGGEVGRRSRRGEPEVGDTHPAVAADQHVVGLEVAVNDASGMSRGEATSGCEVRLDDLGERALDRLPLAQAHPADQLHRDVRRVVGDPDVVDGDDVRMTDLRHRPRLANQALGQGRIGVMQQLQRDLAPEAGVVGAKHDAHRARADALDDREPPELEPDVTRPDPRLRDDLDRVRTGGGCEWIRLLARGHGQGGDARALVGVAQRVDRGVACGVACEEADQAAAVGAVVEVPDRERTRRWLERSGHEVLHRVRVEALHAGRIVTR